MKDSVHVHYVLCMYLSSPCLLLLNYDTVFCITEARKVFKFFITYPAFNSEVEAVLYLNNYMGNCSSYGFNQISFDFVCVCVAVHLTRVCVCNQCVNMNNDRPVTTLSMVSCLSFSPSL